MQQAVDDYRVELDCYSGPLDLLLHLVRRHEIDLRDIPIAQLTEQYIKHLELIQQIDVNLASQFLVMAATLLEIKSEMLLPAGQTRDEEDGESSETLDPRYELMQQLLAYKRFKDAATVLDERRSERLARFARCPGHLTTDGDRPNEDEQTADPIERDLDDVHVLDLCEAFARILDSIGNRTLHKVITDDTPLALHADDIVDRLEREQAMTLGEIFVGRKSRSEMIGLFMAMLELVRQKKIHVYQEYVGGPIQLELRTPQDQETVDDSQQTDWRNAETGQVQYEWPSEELRLRALRRAERRASRPAQRRFEEQDHETMDAGDDEPTRA